MENLDNERQESWRVLDGHYKRQEFEHQLIDRKTTWLLSTQSILFAAYGVTFSRVVSEETVDEFRSVVAWTGVSLSALTMVGVLALVTSKRLYLSKSREYFAGKAVPGPTLGDPIAWGAKTWITVLSLVPDLNLPDRLHPRLVRAPRCQRCPHVDAVGHHAGLGHPIPRVGLRVPADSVQQT